MDVRGWKANGNAIPSFAEGIKIKPEYLKKGLYYDQLIVYLKLIPEDNILILFQEDIEKSPKDICANVYSFIGVDEKFVPVALLSKENVAADYKNPSIFRYSQKFVRLVERVGLERAVIWAKNNGIRDWILKKMEKPISCPQMDEELRAKLREYYYDSNQKLSVLLGRNLSTWR